MRFQKETARKSTVPSINNPLQKRTFTLKAQTTPQKQETPELQTQLELAERFGHNFTNFPVFAPGTPPPEQKKPSLIQFKLTIGQPRDKYEQQADQVVNRMNTPLNQLSGQGGVVQTEEMSKGDLIGRYFQENNRQQQMVQRDSAEGGIAASAELEASIQGVRGSEVPLAESVLKPMETEFGADFSGVRVYTDAKSDQLSQSIQAKAFTTGQDVFFRAGAYDPGSRGGQELLAHELTHVVHQKGEVVQRQITKGEGGQEYDTLDRMLLEFSESYRDRIKANQELFSLLETFITDDTPHSINDVMNKIQGRVGAITPEDCPDILFDPVAKQWVVPDEMGVWQQFIKGYQKSKGKMKLTYSEFSAQVAAKTEQKAASKIPIDLENDEQLRSLWGTGSSFDKRERTQVIIKMFTDSGFIVKNIEESTRSSSDTPPILFDIVGHPRIAKFEVHPGGGIHKAPYIRISTDKGMIKIINKNSHPPYDRLDEKVTYVEVSR